MCLITAGRPAPTSCTGATPGMYNDQLWFFNQPEAAWATVASGVTASVTMDATKTSFRVDIEKGSGIMTTDAVIDENTGAVTFDYTYSCRIASVSTTDRNFVNSLKNWKGTIVGRTKSDTFPVMGIQGVHDPMSISVLKFTTDEGDFGATLEFKCSGNTELPPHFFDTDVTTTVSELVATQ